MRSIRYVGELCLLLSLTSCPEVSALIRKYGYTELRPPSQLMAPGTMVFVKNTKPFEAGVICTQQMSLGESFKPMTAPTANEELNKLVHTRVNLGASYRSLVEASGAMEVIDSISAELSHPVIYTVSDGDILRNIDKRDPLCSEALAARQRAGFAVTMISSALMADIVYHVSWKSNSNLDLAMKVGILSGVAPHLGVSNAEVTEHTISGTNMFWGVTDDLYLAQLSSHNGPGASGDLPLPLPPRNVGEDYRTLPLEEAVAIDTIVDTERFRSADEITTQL